VATIQMWGTPVTITWIEKVDGGGTPEPATGSLSGGTWELISLRNATGTEIPVISGTQITAEFDDDGSIKGSAGCNQYGAEYVAGGEALSGDLALDSVYMTEMYCMSPAGVMEQESAYLGLLSSARAFRIEAGILVLSDEAGSPLLEFRSVAPAG
jgi:heat shock protein HslJ